MGDGSLTKVPELMCERFADEFASVYSTGTLHDPAPHQSFHGHLSSITISCESIATRISSLDAEASMGPDGIHPKLLQSCKSLAYPLYIICKKSLQYGELPLQWKESLVVPIFKKGSRYSPLNYRPISLTSVCCKTLEREIADKLYGYLDSNGLFSDEQYGFRRGMTVEDQLLVTYDSVSKWYDEGYIVDVVLFDFSKAFDVVPHSILLAKLGSLGICGSLLSWIRDFMVGRAMRVSVLGSWSNSREVLSGVPQGSVLGPLLFLIFVNHLPSFISTQCKCFADDLKIYLSIRHDNIPNMVQDFAGCQMSIDTIAAVASSWGLELNKDKCCVLRFSRNYFSLRSMDISNFGQYFIGESLVPLVYSSRDLGVIIDNELKFHSHIRSIAAKAFGLSSNLLSSTVCRAREFMLNLYLSHVRPLLEFGSCVWNSGYVCDLRLLEKVQKRWTKRIDGLDSLSYPQRLRVLNLYSIEGRLLRADLIKCWKIFNNECAVNAEDIFVLARGRPTRGHRFKIAHSHCSLECRKRYFALRVVSTWNSLPDEVVGLNSLGGFKAALHEILGEKLFEFS